MNGDITIEANDLTIICSSGLLDFSKEFVDYYNDNIGKIKEALSIDQTTQFIVLLTDDVEKAGFVYGKSDFSGFFNDKGATAYINLYGKCSKMYLFKCILHELVHHLYKYYVFGPNKKRITWVDEGLAKFLSGQNSILEDKAKYEMFLSRNLENIDDIDLNKLNHDDRSFGANNGYNLSYIAIRYLYETLSHDVFIDTIKSEEKLLELGKTVLTNIQKQFQVQ